MVRFFFLLPTFQMILLSSTFVGFTILVGRRMAVGFVLVVLVVTIDRRMDR